MEWFIVASRLERALRAEGLMSARHAALRHIPRTPGTAAAEIARCSGIMVRSMGGASGGHDHRADPAPFTREDLDEARSRLTRLARVWPNRLDALTEEQLDRSPGEGWTFRQLALHLVGSPYYADALGDLS